MYNEIDRNTLFSGTANIIDRSTMNATFLLTQESLKRMVKNAIREIKKDLKNKR